MSTEQVLSPHPASHRDRVGPLESAFGLVGGPLAWFVQLCVGDVLSSWPCFPQDERMLAPVQGYGWTWAALGLVSLAAVVTAVAASLVSRSINRRARAEHAGDYPDLLEAGSRRTRFLALWGMVAGGAFAVAAAFTAVGFFILPRCAG